MLDQLQLIHMVRHSATLTVLGICIAAAGCGSFGPDGVRTERRPAYVRYYQDPPQLDAPDTIDAGVSFTVTVRTFGGGCIDQGDTEVSVAGQTAELRPFDIFTTHLPRNYACPDILFHYSHTASVRFTESGVAVVRVVGRVAPGDSATTLERTVVVR